MKTTIQTIEKLVSKKGYVEILNCVYVRTKEEVLEDSKNWDAEDPEHEKLKGTFNFYLHDEYGWSTTCKSLSEIFGEKATGAIIAVAIRVAVSEGSDWAF